MQRKKARERAQGRGKKRNAKTNLKEKKPMPCKRRNKRRGGEEPELREGESMGEGKKRTFTALQQKKKFAPPLR